MTKGKTKVDVGEAVGIVAAQSIGEPGTQMSLPYGEKVLVKENGELKIVKIGEFIDSMFERFGGVREGGHKEGGHEICKPNCGLYAPSLLASEKISLCRVTLLSRHNSPKKLVEITLRSGRKITATPFHSFVVRKNNSLLAVPASSLSIGERLPVARNLSCIAAAGQEGKPLNVHAIVQTHLRHAVSSNGFVYAYPRSQSKPMPCELALDGEFGWLAGIYLSEGNATQNYLSISNTNGAILEKARSFARKYNFTTNEYDNTRGFSLGHDLRINSTLLSQLLKATCGTSSYEKQVPAFAYSASGEFVAALLRGYFDGDGNITVQRRAIRASSKSKALIGGLCILLARLGIFATKRAGKKTHDLCISHRYARLFLEKIGSDISEKRAALEALCECSAQTDYNLIDVIPGIGNALKDAAHSLRLPSRCINSFTKRQKIGRSTLEKHLQKFSLLAAEKNISLPQLAPLQRAAESDVVWDEIEKMEEVSPSNKYVYDFTVPNAETFTTCEGIITHNTMRTFHYAGVAEQVPTGLPRLIELVDARKEPKKPFMDIYLSGDASEAAAKELAQQIERTKLDSVAHIEENFIDKTIEIALSASELEALQLSPEDVKKKLKAATSGHIELKENVITIKPGTTSLRNIRRLTSKLRVLHLKGVERIKRALVLKGKDGKHFIRTDGSNLAAMLKQPGVDAQRICTNDVKEVERVLGIEAARTCLVREIKQVLDMQGLSVDVRHCMLLADAMTMDGEVKSIGRHGLSGEKAGVLARAAFEETIKHLIKASTGGEEDRLIGVTENIIVGQTVPVGTGLVRLKMKLG